MNKIKGNYMSDKGKNNKMIGTTMDYEQKYKEVLTRAKQIIKDYKKRNLNSQLFYAKEDLESIFPELKESEDERIRKEMIFYFTEEIPQCSIQEHSDKMREFISWLEKQGEKPQDNTALEVIKEEKVDNQNCVKTTNMVKPKFKVDDFIKHNKDNIICKVISVNSSYYYIENIETGSRIELFNAEQNFHLWTIEDAKDGDVLVEDSCIFIIQMLGDNSTAAKTYCTLYDDGDFDNGTILYFDIDSTKPATKEQRDLLFSKMKEAGYEWDNKKKELKKIEQKLADKVEPKFKVGEWIVLSTSDGKKVVQIDSVEYFKSGEPRYITSEGRWFGNGTKAHLWTIQDAKDGDVLVTNFEEDNIIVMYHSMCTIDTINVHCCFDNKFVCRNLGVFDAEDVKPATKEQRNILFQKMKEAGYVWDVEKKELKKIDNANKVEAKQKSDIEKGKWYVCNTSRYTDFVVGKAYYCPKNRMLKPNENEIARYVASDCFHLWSIADAKDGDVLVDVYENTGIFQKNDDFDWTSYCSLGINGGFQNFKVEHENDKTHPATKEQCDLFFQKMHEAGYMWDEEKKELSRIEKQKSIEPIHFDFSDEIPVPTDPFRFNLESCFYNFGKSIAAECLDTHILDKELDEYVTDKKVREFVSQHIDSLTKYHPLQKSVEWSEEDEKKLDALATILFDNEKISGIVYVEFIKWLKSLKEKCQDNSRKL